MSDTPRTDAAKFSTSFVVPQVCVTAGFARELERELAATRKRLHDALVAYAPIRGGGPVLCGKCKREFKTAQEAWACLELHDFSLVP